MKRLFMLYAKGKEKKYPRPIILLHNNYVNLLLVDIISLDIPYSRHVNIRARKSMASHMQTIISNKRIMYGLNRFCTRHSCSCIRP